MNKQSDYYILKSAVIERINKNQEEIDLMKLARESGVVNLTHRQFSILNKYVHNHFPEYWLDLQYKEDYPDNPTPTDQVLAYRVFSSKNLIKLKSIWKSIRLMSKAL